MPASARTIASQTVAVESPMAPASTWSRPRPGLLWTLMWGRISAGSSRMRAAILSMFRFAAGRSRTSAGVDQLAPVVADRAAVLPPDTRRRLLDQGAARGT